MKSLWSIEKKGGVSGEQEEDYLLFTKHGAHVGVAGRTQLCRIPCA